MPIAWGQEKITLIHDALKNSGVYSDSWTQRDPDTSLSRHLAAWMEVVSTDGSNQDDLYNNT